MLHIIIVGLVAGFIARLLSPGPNNPSGFILTIVLGIVGAFLATAIGQAIGHYGPEQGAAAATIFLQSSSRETSPCTTTTSFAPALRQASAVASASFLLLE